MRCLILLHPFTQSLFIPLDFHRYFEKINMECTFFYFTTCVNAQAVKCWATHLSSLLVYAVFTLVTMWYTEWAIEGAFE